MLLLFYTIFFLHLFVPVKIPLADCCTKLGMQRPRSSLLGRNIFFYLYTVYINTFRCMSWNWSHKKTCKILVLKKGTYDNSLLFYGNNMDGMKQTSQATPLLGLLRILFLGFEDLFKYIIGISPSDSQCSFQRENFSCDSLFKRLWLICFSVFFVLLYVL